MSKNNELINLCGRSIKIMKYLGMFIHRSALSGDSIKRFKNRISFQEEIDDQTESTNNDDVDDFSRFYETHNIIEKTKINKLHFVYCLILTAANICFSSLIIYPSFSGEDSQYEIQTSSRFTHVLIKVVLVFTFISFPIYPIYFLIISSTHAGFYKYVLSFAYYEKKISKFVYDYQIRSPDSNQFWKISSIDKKLKTYTIFYFLAFSFVTAIILFSLFGMIITDYNIASLDSYNITIRVLTTFFFIYVLLLLCTVNYFITKNLIIIQHQIVEFYKILKVVIENKHADIQIEPIRRLYGCLYNHVKTADSWISYYYGIFYVTVIPVFIILLYASIFGGLKSATIQAYSSTLIMDGYFLVLITIVALGIYSKVSI